VKNWRGGGRGGKFIHGGGGKFTDMGRRKFGGSKKTQPKFIYREAAAPPFWEF